MTTNTSDVVSAIRELTNTKQLERSELLDLLKDGLHAALVKRYGPNVRSEIGIDELKGTIRVVVLRTVVETVEDPGSQVALEEARFEDADFQVGDVLEEEVPFEAFGRTAVQAAKQRIIQRVRGASAPGSAKSSPTKSASSCRGRSSRSSAARSW